MKVVVLSCILFFGANMLPAQDLNALIKKVKAKIDLVNDYVADGSMKTNITFLKVPNSAIKMYFKKPNKIKIKNEKGVSFVPKGAVNISLSSVLNNSKYTVIDMGKEKIGSTVVQVVKLLPDDENSDIVLSSLYIDPINLVIRRAKTTTRENGTYEIEMTFGKFLNYALPETIKFTFNTKDYKMPKGITFDFDDGKGGAVKADKASNQKGNLEIVLTNYSINKGVADTNF